MHNLKNTPILFEFIKRLFKSENIKFKGKIEDKLYLYSQCKCGEKHCATVTLKKLRPWNKKFLNSHIFCNVSNGIVVIHFLEKGLLELEAIGYEDFPYKNEVDTYLNHKLSTLRYVKKLNKIMNFNEYKRIKKFFTQPINANHNFIDLGEIEFEEIES